MIRADILIPQVPWPGDVRAAVTTRRGGVSLPPWENLNLATHVGDTTAHVMQNRMNLNQVPGLPSRPRWLRQIHKTDVVRIETGEIETGEIETGAIEAGESEPQADASITEVSQVVLAILTADCLPILLCDANGTEFAAIHAGWKGLADGIIRNCIRCFRTPPRLAYIGPAVRSCHYEVDDRVRQQFSDTGCFEATRPGHWSLDLGAEARRQLAIAGVNEVYDEGICTACDSRFYSYRRDGETGRFATMIWRNS